MDGTFFNFAIPALFGAGFGIGGNLILKYLTSGKVTEDHLKKEDLVELKEEFKKHIERHVNYERDFVKKNELDKHILNCPIGHLEEKLIQHEISHGKHDSEIFTRLKTIEKQMIDSSATFSKLTEGLHSVDLKIGLMVQKMDLFIVKKEKDWDGIERRKEK